MIDMISFRELLINAKNGDEKALMEMFDLFHPMIENASRSANRKDEDLHDIIVMAFIQVISKFPIDKPWSVNRAWWQLKPHSIISTSVCRLG